MILSRIIKDDSDPLKKVTIISMRIPKELKDLKDLTFDKNKIVNKIMQELFQMIINPTPDKNDFKYFDMGEGEDIMPELKIGLELDLELDRDYGEDIVSKALSRFIDCYSFNLKELSKRGWFLEGYIEQRMPEIYEEKFDENTLSFLEEVLPDYYTNNFDGIIEELCERHPSRKDFIINEIVKGYNNGKGTIRLAILGVISQIDGICQDYLGKLFFIKQRNENNQYVPIITRELPNSYSDLFATHLDTIIEDSPIYTHYSNLESYTSKLNRHTSVHGMELDYGGEENFWKIFSLFKFISDALYFFDDSKFETRNLVVVGKKE